MLFIIIATDKRQQSFFHTLCSTVTYLCYMECVQHNPHSFCLEYCHHGNNIFLHKQNDNNDSLIQIQDSYKKSKVKFHNLFFVETTLLRIFPVTVKIKQAPFKITTMYAVDHGKDGLLVLTTNCDVLTKP